MRWIAGFAGTHRPVSGLRAAVTAIFVLAVAAMAGGCGQDTIADGVRIGSVDVGGLERDEARARVRQALADEVGPPVTATYGDREFTLKPQDAQARVDPDATVDAALALDDDGPKTVAPRLVFSRAAVADFAERVAKRLDRKARDADIDWHDGKLDRTRARNGRAVRRTELVSAVERAMSSATAKRAIEVPVRVDERPDRNLDDLAKRYPTVIAVDRDSKQLRLYKYLQLEHKYRIAVGEAGYETTPGRYKIVEKEVDPDWHAPNKEWAGELAGQTIPAGDPRNPLEARWMGFHDGQGIHGTSDIESLGEAASHGCIRMSVRDVKELYEEVEEGTPVFVQ